MKIQQVNVRDIQPYELNAKTHPAHQISGIAESIKQFGFTQPIVLDQHNTIVVGHARFAAAKSLQLKTVPCVKLGDIPDEQVNVLRLIDNKLAETPWDEKMLAEALLEVPVDFNFSVFNVDLLSAVTPKKQIDYNAEWSGMPEFDPVTQKNFRSIIVNFKTENDFKEFQKLIDQSISPEAKYIYHPKLQQRDLSVLEWADE